MPRFTFTDLELIIALSTERNLTDVADKLNVTNSAISHRLKNLEFMLGQPIYRKSGGKKLTDAGERLLEAALSIMPIAELADQDIEEIKNKSKYLRVGGMPSLLMDDVPNISERMKIDAPSFGIDFIDTETNYGAAKAVLDNLCDLALVSEKIDIPGISLQKYRSARLHVLAQYSHPLAHEKTVPLHKIVAHPMIGVQGEHGASKLIDAELLRMKIKAKYSVVTHKTEIQASLVSRTSMGIAVMSASTAKRFSTIYPVRAVPIEGDWAIEDFYVCDRIDARLNKDARKFVEHLKQLFSPV
ncbi:LysR family transcriptional regulator [Undibacterium crateris]|uniref:LysR family transcriptional regulator n=1 Tax=Undibacterium crateris TaxID=2528175 RepID=UPI001389706C|nr:LysR family transcriptional regulator [Undibacterium crateris]NDI85072.1 LysR family transcriptional regulator [Undibacterium crateris]